MNILIFNTLYTPIKVGGAELSVQALAESFCENGHIVGVVTLGEKNENMIINGVKIFRLQIQNNFWPFIQKKHSQIERIKWHIKDVYNTGYKTQIEELFKAFKPEIIHTNNLSGFSVNIWSIAKKHNIKIVHTIRDYYLQCPKTTKFKTDICNNVCLDCRVLSIQKKRASRYVDAVVGISQYILNDHLNNGYFPNARKEVIPNGFVFPETDSNYKIFNKNDFINIGFIGQINNVKGLDILVDALKELIDKKNWQLYIAGKTNLVTEDKYKSKLNERITFLGYVDQKYFFEKINVLVVPSLWEEPFGRVVIEGMMNKKIVLGSDRGGISELLNSNKKFLFEPTKQRLFKLLINIVSSPENLNDFKFNKKHLEKYSIDKTTIFYLNTFRYLIERDA